MRQLKIVTIILSILVFISSANAEPETKEVREGRISAAIIYYLTKYTDWQAKDIEYSEQLQLCIAGKSPLNNYIVDTVAGKELHNKGLQVSFVDGKSSLDNCHVLFAGKGAILPRVGNSKTLTVATTFDTSAMVVLFEKNNKLNLQVNTCEVGKTPLVLSKTLLDLSTVKDECCPRV